jgi:hypothetical protein
MRLSIIRHIRKNIDRWDWRDCFAYLMEADATYKEQRFCESMFDNFHEKRRITAHEKRTL